MFQAGENGSPARRRNERLYAPERLGKSIAAAGLSVASGVVK
jgi:hypothetical protein